ncbi:MAG: class I SAM-dependent methyltransferase [Patescibacteria group bacterium]|nr:class I SAM-dependent methyltransferase [Patescibacteria group bacterium]
MDYIKIILFKISQKVKTYLKVNKFNYKDYWQNRYLAGGNSGAGSYGVLAEFKSDVINSFVKDREIKSIIEFGCGDGNQLKYMNYNNILYLGFDVAKNAIQSCGDLFKNDMKKNFILYDPKYFVNNGIINADLVVCLDVLYHIIPEADFTKTLEDIFSCASKYVILYTSIDAYKSEPYKPGTHVYHRDTLRYLSRFKDFEIEKIIEQKHRGLSSAHFILMAKKVIENGNII